MSKLTEKVKNTNDYIRLAIKDKQEFINKLGRLEEIADELKVPSEFIPIPYYLSGLKKVWYHNQWCDVVRVVAYEEATTPYMEIRCKDYDYLKFIPLDKYKKTFWLKEDKSE